MITRRELLIRIGELQSPSDTIDAIEKYIIEAAEKGARDITYRFTDKTNSEIRDAVLMTLETCGYTVTTKQYLPDPAKYACEITISW